MKQQTATQKYQAFDAQQVKSRKVIILFGVIALGMLFFLISMFFKAVGSRHIPSLYTSSTTKAKRGDIISAEGFHVATTRKLYKASVDTRSIDPDKRELFIELFAIYSGMQPDEVRRRLEGRQGSTVLSYNISSKHAEYLKSLRAELQHYRVFTEFELPSGRTAIYGLSIEESGEARIYPYGTLMTPLIGYPRKYEEEGYTRNSGIKGLEKLFDEDLQARQNGYAYAPRDIANTRILTAQRHNLQSIDGFNLKLTVPVTLQIRVEQIVDEMKRYLRAKEIMVVIMEAQSGQLLSVASSNRYRPTNIHKSDYPSLNCGALEYSFEPGSVLKPLTFALLLEHGKVSPYDIVNAHNGRYRMGRKLITDEHKYQWLSAENVIVHSSNIGIAQLAQKLDGHEFFEGLYQFGLTRPTGMRWPYEKIGTMPSIPQLGHEIYKATTSYGYGLRANLMQLVRAYNIFNNRGILLTPTVVQYLIDPVTKETITLERDDPVQVLSAATAEQMKRILVKTVRDGTGQGTITPGVEVGGKTGTAHIASRGRYVNRYNASFLGIANDATRRYTIGVTVVEPKKYHFASLTAVATFKKVIDMMITEGYLTPEIVETAEL